MTGDRTVLVLNPMGADIMMFMPSLLRGTIAAMGPCERVDYVNQPGINNIIAGTANLHSRIMNRNAGERIVVFAYSEGGQVASRWLRLHGPSLPIAPADIEFILIGNAVRKYGGFAYQHDAFAAVADIEGIPANTPYKVTDFARQYDGVADFPTAQPIQDALVNFQRAASSVDYLTKAIESVSAVMNDPASADAMANAIAGMAIVHNWYLQVTLNDPKNLRYTEGNITYVLSPTDPMPLAEVRNLFGSAGQKRRTDRSLRPGVERAYSRPFGDEPVLDPGAGTDGIDPRTLNGEFTAELRQHLLERRWGYMHRRTKRPLVRLWDKEMQFIARVENLDKWDWEELATEDGEAHISFSGKVNAWLREIVTYQIGEDEDIHLTIDPDPDNPHDWRTRWGGKVVTIEDDDNAGEASVTTLNCISNRRHLKGIYLAANPIFPAEVQLPKMFLWGGGTASTCATATWVNCFRLFSLNGFSALPRNLFAPETWLQNLSPLNWPVQVMPVNPLLDQSRWCTIGARWKDAHTILSPVMKDASVICRAYTWLPGDPAPYTMFGPEFAELLKPTRACVILSFENVSGVTGPTGTMLDGAINLFAATLDDLITETFIPYDDPTTEEFETDPFFRKLLLVAPKPPPFVYRDVGYGNVNKAKKVIHKSQATDIVVGGKSPQWLNMAITFAIRWGISQLANVISLGPGGATQAPGSEGLDNLYQGQLDDVFLAFQRFVNPLRSAKVGSYAFREYFHQGHGSAYTINALQDLASGERAMKAYTSLKFDVTDGQPYIYGEDYWLGDRAGAEIRGVTWIDNILAVRAEGSRESAGRIVVSFGDDEREEDPIARGFRTIGNVANFAGLLAGSGDLF